MKIEVRKKVKPKCTIGQLNYGTVFNLKDFVVGENHSSNERYIKCKGYIVSLDNYDVIQTCQFWSWFAGTDYRKLDSDLQYDFEDTFLDREVNIYDSILTLEVD